MTMTFEHYRTKNAPRQPDLRYQKNADELTQQSYCIWDGTAEFTQFSNLAVSIPHMDGKEIPKTERLLWVVASEDVRCAHEHSSSAKSGCTRGYLSHTNITGGKPAHSGGQLVFVKEDNVTIRAIFIDGRSSRYMPRSATEMKEIAQAFSSTGYDVYSLGWDDEINEPSIAYRSNNAYVIKQASL